MILTQKELIAHFELKYRDIEKLIILKRAPYLAIIFSFFIGVIIFAILTLTNVLDVTLDDLNTWQPIYWTAAGVCIVVAGPCIYIGWKVIWGSSEAYKNSDGTFEFIGHGKYQERIVTLRINKIEEYHGFYCLKENYFKFVFVPLDFPIDQLPVSSVQKTKKK